MKRILFLCSGNYYRSRFAELFFNHLAQEHELEWRAESRGIIAQWSNNPGPISDATLQGLEKRNIPAGEARAPIQLSIEDLAAAERVIALYETEHRPLMSSYFPEWAGSIEYWQVPDMGEMDAEEALALMEYQALTLVQSMQHKRIEEGDMTLRLMRDFIKA